jgi:excisionase family DNA binding protein
MSIPAPAGRRSAGPPQPANHNPRQLGHELPQPATRSSTETPGRHGALSAIAGSQAAPEPGEPEPVLDPQRLAYSIQEAARLTGLSRDLLYDQMRQGNLSYIKIGRRRLITRQHLQQFLGLTS